MVLNWYQCEMLSFALLIYTIVSSLIRSKGKRDIYEPPNLLILLISKYILILIVINDKNLVYLNEKIMNQKVIQLYQGENVFQ